MSLYERQPGMQPITIDVYPKRHREVRGFEAVATPTPFAVTALSQGARRSGAPEPTYADFLRFSDCGQSAGASSAARVHETSRSDVA